MQFGQKGFLFDNISCYDKRWIYTSKDFERWITKYNVNILQSYTVHFNTLDMWEEFVKSYVGLQSRQQCFHKQVGTVFLLQFIATFTQAPTHLSRAELTWPCTLVFRLDCPSFKQFWSKALIFFNGNWYYFGRIYYNWLLH